MLWRPFFVDLSSSLPCPLHLFVVLILVRVVLVIGQKCLRILSLVGLSVNVVLVFRILVVRLLSSLERSRRFYDL